MLFVFVLSHLHSIIFILKLYTIPHRQLQIDNLHSIIFILKPGYYELELSAPETFTFYNIYIKTNLSLLIQIIQKNLHSIIFILKHILY